MSITLAHVSFAVFVMKQNLCLHFRIRAFKQQSSEITEIWKIL